MRKGRFSLTAGGATAGGALQFPPDRETKQRRDFGEDTLSPHRCAGEWSMQTRFQNSILNFPCPLWKVQRERTPCTVCGEITLALSQHWSQNGPIKQMAPDPTPEGGAINTESRAIDHASHSQLGEKKIIIKQKQLRKQ